MSAKLRIKQAFGNASSSYDSVAQLQRNVGRALMDKIGHGSRFGTVIDIGSGTGYMVHEFLTERKCFAEQIVALDIALPMLRSAKEKLNANNGVGYLCADLEALPLISSSADLVISNAAYQWSRNPGKAFAEVGRVLRPGGRFMFTTFGANTLFELRDAWRSVDAHAHVNDFYSGNQISALLEMSGFAVLQINTECVVSDYPSVWDLMIELKSLGARTVIEGAKPHLTSKSAMERMMSAYRRGSVDGNVPATFEIISVAAEWVQAV